MISVKEMQALERAAHKKGIFTAQLMDNAGAEVYRVIKEKYGLDDKHIAIFAGTGNNAGDGFVTAAHCAEECPVIVFLFGEEDHFTEETRDNYDKIKDHVTIIKIEQKEELKEFHFQKNIKLIAIDALLGTGISGEVRSPITDAIDYFNALNALKVAIDIPSGIDADNGTINGKACDVDLIVTLHDIKLGLEQFKEKTIIVDIGLR